MRREKHTQASWTEHGGKLRRSANRKLRQRRAWRTRVRLPEWRTVGQAAWGGARRLAPTLVVLLAVALTGLGGWRGWVWLTHSPRFAIQDVVVTGNTRVTDDEIARHAGMATGANLFKVSMGTIARAVESNPWIEEARVSRQMPDALRIEVSEREPAGLLVVDAAYLVDREGRPFKRAELAQGEADGLVVVTGLDRSTWTRDADGSAAAVREALTVAARWHAAPDRPPVGEVHVARTGITLYTLEGAVAVRLGRARGEDLAARLRRFDAIWAALSDEERTAAKTIYLDSATRADRVTVQLADAR